MNNYYLAEENRTLRAALAARDAALQDAKLRAYRQARIFEPNMDGYHAAMSVYAAAFGKPDGEPTILLGDGEAQGWELDAGPEIERQRKRADTAERALSDTVQTLQALETQWRRSCEVTRAELLTFRRDYPEGPRYGIAAVESCADDLARLRATLAPQAET